MIFLKDAPRINRPARGHSAPAKVEMSALLDVILFSFIGLTLSIALMNSRDSYHFMETPTGDVLAAYALPSGQ